MTSITEGVNLDTYPDWESYSLESQFFRGRYDSVSRAQSIHLAHEGLICLQAEMKFDSGRLCAAREACLELLEKPRLDHVTRC